MDVAVGRVVGVGAQRSRFFASPSANFWRPGWKRSAVSASTASSNCCETDLQSPAIGKSILRGQIQFLGVDGAAISTASTAMTARADI
jgi:hypothetical protein